MKTTEEDSEVFEITDFTTASEWERFIARLEEVFHEWKLTTVVPNTPLPKGELTTGTWEEQTETLQFADFRFIVSHHRLKQKEPSPDPASGHEESGRRPTDTREDVRDGSGQTDPEEGAVPLCWLDMMSVENDFPSRAHCLVRWYALRQFVILAPAVATDSINTESRINILLSSISICLNNIGCQVPVFVQVQSKWRRFYMGQCETTGFRTSFEMVHLKHGPPQYGHLAGLLDVFKAKLNSPVSPLPPVSVSVRFTYVLQDWNAYNWSQAPPDIDSMMGAEVGCTEFGELPFGACEDPVSELHLSTTWPSLSEEMIVDTDVYSDLDPLQAPIWNVRVRMAEEIQCLLGDYLEEFVQLCRRQESTDQLLGGVILDDRRDSNSDGDISQALQRLTEPVSYNLPSLGTVVTRATSKLQIRPEEAPIASDLLNEILLFLFPDARTDTEDPVSASTTPAATPVSETAPPMEASATSAASVTSATSSSVGHQYKEMFRQLKSAPVPSLTTRLAVCLCIVNHSYGGLRAVAHLWQEFVLEMRYRWENNYLIPDLEAGSPNMGCSLLHQKLQMLNCCIQHKISRQALQAEGGYRPDSPDGATGPGSDVLSSSDDEEFFDVDEDVGERGGSARRKDSRKAAKDEANARKAEEEKLDDGKDTGKENAGKETGKETGKESVRKEGGKEGGKDIAKETERDEPDAPSSVSTEADLDQSFKDSWTHQADGRLRPCDNLLLISGEGKLYLPVTQQPAPMTEDLLEEHAEVLARLGTSPEGAHLRARMQSACLLSDMEAFKAANPGCTLGDFVRWYSPRDWVEEETTDEQGIKTTTGALSARMQIPGNMWAEVWQSAKPVPVRRQKRLFDDTKEAEKVLHFLSALRPADVAMRLMPMLIHAAIVKLLEQEESSVPAIKQHMDLIMTKAAKVMRAPRLEARKFEDLIRQLNQAEVLVTRAQSLKTKFSEEERRLSEGPLGASRTTLKSSSGSEERWALSEEVTGFTAALLEQPEVSVLGSSRGPVGTVVHGLFATAQKAAANYLLEEDEVEEPGTGSDFPVPAAKEYILRTSAARPAPWSRPAPQRLYCVVVKDDFRLAGAFSSDTTFQ